MNLSTEYPIIRYDNGTENERLDEVVIEYELTIIVNQQEYKKILCSPESFEELVIGELITEEIMSTMDDIDDIIIDELNKTAHVLLNDLVKHERSINQINREELLVLHKISTLFKTFVSSSNLFRSTGGVHSCAIVDDKGIVFHQDDISRSNAVNKVIGFCYKNNIFIEDKLLFTSCRLSSEIIKKVIRSGIGIIISKSAPTDVAIKLAKKNNIILFGFVRGNSMNRYC